MKHSLRVPYHLDFQNALNSSQELRSVIEEEDCLLVTGSGLLRQACTKNGYMSISQPESLCEAMVEWGIGNGIIDQYAVIKDFRTLLQQKSLLQVGYKIEEYLSEKSLQQQCLQEVFPYSRSQVSEMHRMLAQLPFRGYLTTTYDTLLETAYTVTRQKELPKFYLASLQHVLKSYHNRQPFILKLRGDIEEAASIVLNHHNFQNFLAPDHLQGLREMFSESTILLVGFEYAGFELQCLKNFIISLGGRKLWSFIPSFIRIEEFRDDESIWYQPGKIPPAQSGLLEQRSHYLPPQRFLEQRTEDDEYRCCSMSLLWSSASSVPSAPKPLQTQLVRTSFEIASIHANNSQQDMQTKNDVVTPPEMATSLEPAGSGSAKTIEIFISSVEEDEKLLEELREHLKVMKYQYYERKHYDIKIWHTNDVTPGQDWKQQIEQQLMRAHIILLLVSIKFLISDLCRSIQIQPALARHNANEACVIPVILRACDWKLEAFGHLYPLPAHGKPVIKWKPREDAYVNIILGIRRAIDTLPGASTK